MEASLCVFFYIQAGMIDVTVPSDAPAPGTTSGAVMPTELANDGDTNVEMFKWAAIGMSILLVVQFMGVIAAVRRRGRSFPRTRRHGWVLITVTFRGR